VLLGAVVQVALYTTARFIGRDNNPRARLVQILLVAAQLAEHPVETAGKRA
jgi:hypothetical protein